MKPRDWSRFHERNIIREEVGVYSKLEAGQIVRFNYKGEYARVKRPLVLVLNPRWNGKLHAVSLDYISDAVLLKLRKIVQETLQQRLQQLTRLRLPLLKADIKDPQKFYYSRLKPFIRTYFDSTESPYRQYIVGNITNLRTIDYRFKDFYVDSTGEQDTVRGKTRER
jgi:hypothetical protein